MIGIGRDAPPPSTDGGVDAPGAATDAAADEERRAQALLASVSGLGPVTLADLLARIGPGRRIVDIAQHEGSRGLAEALLRAPDRPPSGRPSASRAPLDRIVDAVRSRAAFFDRIDALGLRLVTLDDPRYPARLRAIEMPPPVLYVQGDPAALEPPRAIAVVGTRRPTEAGRRIASRIAGAIARTGAVVVSGLAIGIDGAAHAAAIAERGTTVAVLGGGHGRLFPRAHDRLAARIAAEGGAVIAELPPDSEPSPGTFPRRNRVISGLAEATVVVEAAARSGALITASWALEQGRGCFLVPGPLDAPSSAGCLAFLREWAGEARIVAGVPELLEDLELAAEAPDRATAPATTGDRTALAGLGSVERTIALALLGGCSTVDDLVATVALPVATVLGALTLLELRGLVAGSYGRYLPVGRLAGTEPPRRGRRAGGARGSGRGRFAPPATAVLP